MILLAIGDKVQIRGSTMVWTVVGFHARSSGPTARSEDGDHWTDVWIETTLPGYLTPTRGWRAAEDLVLVRPTLRVVPKCDE